MMFLLPTLLLSTAVLAAPHGNLQHRHTSPKRDYPTTLDRMTDAQVEAIYKTCWGGQLAKPVIPPSVDVVAPQLSIFPRPAATPNRLTVTNYCSYPITYSHFDGGAQPVQGTLDAGASINRALTGSVFKASKKADMSNELLVEYAAVNGDLWYNISMITCVVGEDDLSNCPGHDGGLQLGNAVSKSFQCAANSWCDDQAYVYPENVCKKQNPVSMCNPSLGLTMEFCAGARR